MTQKTLALTLLTTAASLAFAANAHAVTYAYYQNSWSTNVPSVHAGLSAATLSDGIKLNAMAPVFGNGVTVGVIDTGSTASWVGFKGITGATGKIIGSVNCLGATCVNASLNSDGHGHGTFVTSQIIGGYNSNAYDAYGRLVPVVVPGVAPGANAIAVKVLDNNGSGDTAGVSRGIVHAANAGAQVLNLSLGPFDQSLVAAVNAAAAKNAYIVFAGGNNGQTFNSNVNISGLTDEAIKRLVFVGATDNYGNLASFSTKPGTGKLISTTGKSYDVASIWLMAPGMNITGASNLTGQQGSVNCGVYSCLTSMSGTSMAAPQVSGAIALLLSQWPILKQNGTAAHILEYAASYLGGGTAMNNGVTQYTSNSGQGFLNVANAFRPMDKLMVTNLSGKSVAASSITSASMLASTSLSTAQLTTVLKNYTAIEATFGRNFSIDLSALVATRTSTSTAAAAVAAPKTTVKAAKLADGSSFAFGNSVNNEPVVNHFADTSHKNNGWFMSFTDATGSTMAAGSGFPASASFAGAMWGSDSAGANLASTLGVSNAILSLAEGGSFAAYGTQLDKATRMAFSWSQTQDNVGNMTASTLAADATAFGTGITTQISKSWTAGVTMGLLSEKNGLMGSTYTANGPIGFGDNHRSLSMGVSSAFTLGNKRDLLLDAAVTRTDGARMSEGLVSEVSTLYARSLGAALVQRDAVKMGDTLSFSVRAPLRVVSGSATLATTSVDADGYPVLGGQRVSLRPTGNQIDFSMGYQQPVDERTSWNMIITGHNDDGNVSGAKSADFLVGAKLTF